MAAELLAQAAQEELTQLDEKLFLKTFSHSRAKVDKPSVSRKVNK